jgi:hypothetical protein
LSARSNACCWLSVQYTYDPSTASPNACTSYNRRIICNWFW